MNYLGILLENYANGADHRREIADNIVAEFRPILRKEKGAGANYDGPLFARIMEALEAAEKSGVARSQTTKRRAVSEEMKQRFNKKEVQRCLLCKQEYRPAVELHNCTGG